MPKKNPKHDSLRVLRKNQVIPPGIYIPGGPARRVTGWKSPQSRAKNLRTQQKHLDILHDIEAGIAAVYQEYPDLDDTHALQALRALLLHYSNPDSPLPPLSLLAGIIYSEVEQNLVWRVNRVGLTCASFRPIIDSLECVLDSAQFWHRQGGSHGYLNYMSQFL
jgi:hypothetical protein